MAYNDELNPVDPLDQLDAAAAQPSPMPVSQFDAVLSGQPMPNESADAFSQRRRKLADLGALGPRNLPSNDREAAQGREDSSQVRDQLARRMESQARTQDAANRRAAAAAESARKKQWQQAGIELQTADDGSTTPATHADGRIKYKADMLGDAYKSADGRVVRDYRDEFGGIAPVDLEANGDVHTDAQTGERYVKNAGGLRVNLGVDEQWQQREQTRAKLDGLRNEQTAAEIDIAERKLAAKPVIDEWQKQDRETRDLRKLLEKNKGLAATQPAVREIIAKQEAQWAALQPAYDAAKKAYEAATGELTTLEQSQLARKREALTLGTNLDALKAKARGVEYPADSLEAKANATLKAVQAELQAAQDEARTAAATAGVVNKALSGGATATGVEKIGAAGSVVSEAINAKVKAAQVKMQAAAGMVGELDATNRELEAKQAGVNARLDALNVELQKLHGALLTDPTADRATIGPRLDALDDEAKKTAGVLDGLHAKRKSVLEKLTTTFDDPAKWEQSPERGLALKEVETRANEMQQAGGTAVEGAILALDRASGHHTLVDGKPIKEQILQLRQALEVNRMFLGLGYFPLAAVAAMQEDGLANDAGVAGTDYLNARAKADAGRGDRLADNKGDEAGALEAFQKFTQQPYVKSALAKFRAENPGARPEEVSDYAEKLAKETSGRVTKEAAPADEDVAKYAAGFETAAAAFKELAKTQPKTGESDAAYKAALAKKTAEMEAAGVPADIVRAARQMGDKTWNREKGFFDAFPDVVAKDTWVPFVAGMTEIQNVLKVKDAAENLEKGAATNADIELLHNYLSSEQQPRTMMYNVVNIVAGSVSFAGEMMATGGIATLAEKATLKGATKVLEKLASKGAREWFEKQVARNAATKFATALAGKAALRTVGAVAQFPVSSAFRITAGVIERTMPDITLTGNDAENMSVAIERGASDGHRGQSLGKAMINSLGDQFVELWSEKAGGALRMTGGAIAKTAIGQKLMATAFMKAAAKLNPMNSSKLFASLAKSAKFDGVIAEMFEERLGEVARAAMDIDGQKYTLPTREQLLTELIAFSVPMAAGAVAGKVFGGSKDSISAVAGRTGGVRMSDGYNIAHSTHTDALAGLDEARAGGDAAKIIIATDAVNSAETALDDATGVLLRVSPRTQHAIAAPLKSETKALTAVLEENEVLRTAAVGIGAEVRDAYLPGNAAAAAEAAARNEKGFDGPTGAKLAGLVVDQMVGGAVARDLASIVQGNNTLTLAKMEALIRIGLLATDSTGRAVVTDDGVALLPKALRKQIEGSLDPANEFGVMVTAGNSGDIVRGLVEQGRRAIAGRTGAVAKQQAAALAQAIAPTPAPQTQGATATFAVTVQGKTKAGNVTQTYPAIPADDAAGAEAEARRRAASVGINVTSATVDSQSPIADSQNEDTETPQQQGDAADQTGQTPTAAAVAVEAAQGTVQAGEVATPASTPSSPAVVDASYFNDPGTFYRVVVGDGAYQDIVDSGLVRTNAGEKTGTTMAEKLAARPTAFPSFSAGSASMSYAASNPNHYIITTTDPSIQPSTAGRHGKGTTMFPTDANGKALSSLSAQVVTVYRHMGDGKYQLVFQNGLTVAPSNLQPAEKAKPAKPAPTPAELTRRKFEAAFKKAMAGDKSAKSFGALNVKIVRGAALPADKWIGANKTAAGKFSLLFNSENAAALFPGKTDAEITTLVETAIGEELIHLAQFEVLRKEWDGKGQPGDFNAYVTAFYTKLFNTLDTATKEAVRKIYGGNLGGWQLSAEGVRQLVQLRKDGKLTEQFVKQFTDHLRAIVDFLKSMLGKAAAKSDMLAKAVTDTEAMLAEIEGAVVEKVVEPPKPAKKKAAKAAEPAETPAPEAPKLTDIQQEIKDALGDFLAAPSPDMAARDAEYMAAVERGDMAAAQRMVDAAAKAAGYEQTSYRMQHQAPSRGDNKLADIKTSGLVPDDYWTHPHYYATTPEERESHGIVTDALRRDADFLERKATVGGKQVRAVIVVYRAVPKDVKEESIRNGDWVTPSRQYAQSEGKQIDGGYKILTKRARLTQLYWDGNSIAELGFDAGTDLVYKNTKNNRKSILPVTRDEDGNVIPLSQRFNSRNSSMLYAPSPAQSYDEVLPVDRLAQIVGLSQSLVSKGVKTPEALAENLTALGPKAVSISQRLWQLMHGFGAEGPLQPDWQAIYAPAKATQETAATPTETAVETKPEEPAKEYAYGMHNRPLQIGAQPKGFTRADEKDKRGRHGVIYYNRPLTAEEIASFELKDLNAKEDGVVDTIAGRMNLDEFEAKGYAPEQVTKQDWINLQRANRRKLGQDENGDSKNAPNAEYEEYHKNAVAVAVRSGEDVDPEVLKDYPDLKKKPETPQSPLQREWSALKAQHPDKLIAVRLGDFIEFFNDDAKKVAKTLNVTLTNRQGVPMAGVPYYSQERDFATLTGAGQSIALADIGKSGKREITQVFDAGGEVSATANPLIAKAETLGLTENILARIARGQTDEQIGSVLGLSDGAEMAAAVRASGMEMPKNPNIGREWNSPYGRQRIVAVDEFDTGSGPSYDVETVGDGTIRRYLGRSLEEDIKRDEYALTPEYAAEKEKAARNLAAKKERERIEAEEEAALKQDVANFGAAMGLSKLEIGKAQKAMMVQVARDIDGKRVVGPRVKVVRALVEAGYVGLKHEKEWWLRRTSDGLIYTVTKTEVMFANWIAKGGEQAKQAVPEQPAAEKEAWQYTREEFRDAFEKKSPLIPSIYTTTGEMVTPKTTGWGWHVDSRHKQLVTQAIAAGKAVPENVIASHPEIAKQRERDAIKAEQKKATGEYLAETRGGNKLRSTPREGTPEREALKAKSKAIDAQIEALSIEIDALRTKRGKAKNDGQRDNIQRAIDGAEKRREEIRTASAENRTQLRKAILEDVIEDGEEINAAFALEELTGESNPELFDRAKAIAVEAFKAAGFNDTDAGFYGTDVVSSVASTFAVKDRAFSKYLAFSVDLKTRQRTIWEARAQIDAMKDADARKQFLAQLSPAESRGDVKEAMRVLAMAQKYAASSAAVAKEQAPDPQPTSLRGDAKQVSGSAAAAEASTKGRNTEPKVMKAQKQFITEALAEAIAEAPEEIDPAQPKHIKIAVPNDGTFFLVNTKAVLKQFAEKVNKGNAFSRKWVSPVKGERLKETDSQAVPFVTSGFPTGQQSDDTPEPAKIPNQSAVPKLGKPKSVEDWVNITEPFRGNEPSRYQLHGSYGDGERVYASNGRVAIAVNAPNAGKKDALQAFGSPKEKMTVATLDGLKGMLKRKGKALAKGIDTDHLWSMLKAAKQAESDRFHSVRIWLNPDHRLGVSLWGNPDTMLDSGAYYAGNMQDNATELGMFNVDFLLQIVGAVRASGSEFMTVSDDTDGEFAFHFTSESGAVHAMLMQTRSDMTAEQEIEEMARRGVAGLTPEQKQEIQTRAEELLKVKLANLHPSDYVDHFEALNEVRLKIPAAMPDLQYLTAQASDKLKDMVFSLLSDGTKYGWSQFASRKADDPAKINMLVGVREQLAKASRPVAEPMPRKDATAPKPAAPAAPAAPVEEKKAPDPLRNMSEADRAEAVRLGNAIEKQEAILDREWILDLKVRGAIDDPKWDIVMSAQIRRAKLQKLLWEAGFDSLDRLSADVYAALGIKNLAPHLDMGIHLDALRDISDYAAEGNKEKLDRFKVTNPVESYHWEKYLSKGIALDKDALDLYNDREAATFAQRFYADTAGSAEKTIRAMYDNDAHSAAEAWIDDHLDRTIDQHIESTRWSDDERNQGVGWSDYSAEIPVYRFTDGKYYTFTKLEMVDGEKVIRIKEIAPRQIVIPKDSVDKGLAAKKSADRKAWIAGGNDREIAPGYKPRTTGGLFDVAKKAKDYTAKIAHARRLLEKIDKMLESDDIGRDRIDSLEGRAMELEKQITDWQRGLVQAQIDRQNREAIAQASKSMDVARENVNEPKASDESFEQRMNREEDMNDWIKSSLESKRPPQSAEEAWSNYTAFDRSRGVVVQGKDYFISAWEAFQKPESATPPVNINARHTLDTSNVLTPGGALKASVIGNAASDAWHHQGDIQHIFFTDKATVNGQSGSTEYTRRTIAEYKAAKAAGWDYVNKRAGSYGTLYVFQRGKEILTNAGAAALVTGKFTAPVVENKAGYEELVRAQSEYAKPFVTWMLTLPDSTLESASAFGAKLSTTAIGKWVSTDSDNTKDGYNFWFLRDGKRHIGVSGTNREAAIFKLVALAMPDEEGRPSWEKDQNRGWKTIGEALDAYAAATGRVRTGIIDPMASPVAAPKPAEETPQATTLLGTRKFLTALLDGEVTAEQVKEQWAKFKASKDQIFADMMALKKDDLMPMAGMRSSKSDTKESIARSVWDSLMSYFNPTDSLQYGIGRDMESSKMAAMEKVVATWTDETIAAKSEERKKAKAERERAAKAPETAEEWERFVYNRGRQKPTPAETIEFKKLKGRDQVRWLIARGEKMLTPEELAAYDAVRAKERKELDQNRAENKAVVYGVTAPTETDIIETKHTQKGHDLFVVKLGDRVERSIYDQLNSAAKKLGGYYSSYKGAGAIPGFQFRTRENAEAFQKIARGETVDRSDEVAANRESKVQSAAERLEAMAARMEESGNESLNADRKTNTAKRAREASGAENAARRQIAMAKTLKNLAAAMKDGKVTHLDGITNATQVATLRQQALRAKDASERKKELSYQKREELKDVEPYAEQMGDAEYPYPFVNKSDVLKLVALGRETDGAKLLAERLSKLTLPRDGGEMGHIENPVMIETFRELAKKLSERGKSLWDTYSWKFDDYDRLQRMGIRDLPTLRAALREFVQYQGDAPAVDPIKLKERALVGKNWQGFFPTPAPIVERMIAEAGIEDGMTVLEPSAGKGDIADAARDAGAMVDTVEIVGELRELLEAKGHRVIGNDIKDKTPRGFTYGDTFKAPDGKTGIMRGHPGGPHSGRVRLDDETGKTLGYYFRDELEEVKKNGSNSGYDRVLMNPPFEDGKDMDHVMHAFTLLRPGGKLVAVMGEGAFSRSDKKAVAFREWLDEHGGTSEKLPVGSFASADAFRQTGTSTRLVVITRDEVGEGLGAAVPDAGPFYSQLTRAVTGLPQAVMTVQQARAAIEKGAKKDEVAMSGILTDPLSPLSGKQPGDKVTRDELIGFALEREAKVEDVVYGKPLKWEVLNNKSKASTHFESRQEADAFIEAHRTSGLGGEYTLKSNQTGVSDTTHFSQYQLPGADEGSYREMFVTWPKNSAIEAIRSKIEASVTNEDELHMQRTGEAPERLKPLYAALKEAQKREYGPEWNDGHSQYSDIANPIVRIRRNIRTDANGVKTYFIEEMQGPNKDGQAKMPAEIRKRIYEIGMKRALRDAVDEGADAIGWTTGEQQAERYSLEKHIDRLEYWPDHQRLTAYKDGITQIDKTAKPEELENYVGKEVAKKLLETPPRGGVHQLYDNDLKVGGEGLKRLYDVTLPSIANDLAKKFGVKVGTGELRTGEHQPGTDAWQDASSLYQRPDGQWDVMKDDEKRGTFSTIEAARAYAQKLDGENQAVTIHSLPIPEALRAQQLAGNALFAPSPIDLKQVGEEAKATQAELANPTANQSLPSAFLDMVRMGIKGSRDRVDAAAPGAAAAMIDAQVTGAKTKAALREMLGKLKGEIDETLGKTKDAKGNLRRKQFVAELLPVAARLNATGRDAHGNLVFSDFAMRAGTAGKKQVEAAGFTTGDIWRGRDGEKLRIGEYLEEQKAYQLFRDMDAPRQAGLYADFEARYPELVHLLNSWIDPDLGDMRVTDDRGTVLPAFNRHALRKFFGDVSPHGGLDEVAGYVPEISRTRSLAGILTMAVRNLLNRRWKSGAHEYKTGDAREHKQVHDLVTAFGIRAMEAHAEAQRKATAEALLNVAVRPMPPGGLVPEKYVRINPDNLASLVQAYGAAHGMTPEQLRKFTKAVNTMDQRALKLLVGQAWAKIRENHIIHRDALAELVRPLTDRVIRNKAVAVVSSLMKAYVGGLLVHPFTWLTNMGSNELFKAMRIGQQTLFGGMMMAQGLKRGATAKRKAGKVALREAWELSKLMLYGRFTNKAAMNQIVPKELFENNTSISGAVMSITEDNMTAVDHLKQANVPQAILKAVRYSDMDVRAKQQLAYASIIANAQVAADEAVKKGFKFATKAQRAKWMQNWINNAGPELQRDAYNTAVAYAMDYENVPWWLDDSRRSPEANVIVSGLFPFAKWPYNMLRQMKRFGGDSSLDVLAFLAGKVGELTPGFKGTAAAEQLRAWKSGRMVNGTKLANAVAHLGTYAMMMAVMRALLSTADDEDEVGRLGRSFDQMGDRLEREFDTSNRVKINDVPILGKAVEALARMHGDDGTKQDYWLRVRNIPYAAPMLAMASTMSWLGAKDDKAKGYKDESLNAWREFVSDFVSEGIVMSAVNAVHGNESKYVRGQPVSATLGAMAVDLGASRIAPVPLLSAARDLVDPNMRRLNQNDSLGYDPGFVEGVKSRIPGLADDLPLKGTVRTRTLENAIEPLAKIPANEKNSVRIHTDEKGKPVASYVDPEDKRDIPRYRTALRFLGLNVKATDRSEYEMAVKGQIKSYRKLLKDLEE